MINVNNLISMPEMKIDYRPFQGDTSNVIFVPFSVRFGAVFTFFCAQALIVYALARRLSKVCLNTPYWTVI